MLHSWVLLGINSQEVFAGGERMMRFNAMDADNYSTMVSVLAFLQSSVILSSKCHRRLGGWPLNVAAPPAQRHTGFPCT